MPKPPPESPEYSVSVVIVNYNGGNEILACLNSLQSTNTVSLEIIVVDNGSTDGSPAQVSAKFPEVKLITLEENRGFAAGCNAGIHAASGRAILLLNPDTEVVGDAVGTLYTALKQHAGWGIVGARMLNSKGQIYPAARRFPTPRDLAFQATGLARHYFKSRYFNGYLYGERDLETLDEVDQIEGSCLMISEQAREAVGNLDEQFFIFFEEVDWCKRVKAAGFEIHVVNEATVKHRISSTMSRYYDETRKIHAQSAMKFFRKHEGEAGYQKLRGTMSKALLFRAGLLLLPALLGIPKMRKRLSGTLAERRAYKEGLAR